MKKTLTLLVLVLFMLVSAGGIVTQQNEEDEKFQKTVEEYLDALWKFYPTAGTMAGFHKYDGRLEDLSKKNIEKRHEDLDEHNQNFIVKVDKLKLSPDAQIDHEIMLESIDMQLIRHESLVPWSYNPLFYNDIFDNCVRSLMSGDFGTPDDRAKNAIERLKDLPKLIKQAQENLETPPEIYTATAIKQFAGILNYYQNELPQLIEQAPSAHQAKLQENLNKAIPALQQYQNFLQNDLLNKSTGNFRLAGTHGRLLRILLQNDLPLQDLVARAQADEKNIRREMLLVCMPFYQIMDPTFDLNNPPSNLTEEQLINAVVTHVMERFQDASIEKEQLIQVMSSMKNEVRDFIQQNQIIDLPDKDIQIVSLPAEARGYTWTRFVKPGAYNPNDDYSLQIGIFSQDFTDEQIDSLLKEYNNYFLPFYVIRKIFPGDFVPSYILNGNTTSLVRKLYPNIAMVKGWPLFLEETLIKTGFGNYDLRLRLNQLKYRLKASMDFILELNVHQGGMTKEQAMAYMTRMGFQSHEEAENNWNNMCLYPGDAVFAYVGYQEFLEMEKAYQQQMGDSYNQKDFLQKLLSFGNMPLRHLKKKMAE